MRLSGRDRWGDLVTTGQVLAPGMHSVAHVAGGRRLFGGWYEELYCRGCRIRFSIRGRSVQEVGKLTDKLHREHSFHMSWTAVFTQLAEFKWAAKAVKIKFKADLTGSVYGNRSEAHGTVR